MKVAIIFLCIGGHLVYGSAVSRGDTRQVTSQAATKKKAQVNDPEKLQGCYELSLSPWRPDLNIGEDIEFITPPLRIQLFAERGTKGWESDGYIVKPAPGVPPSIHRGSYWLPKDSRGVEIVWTTGFSGLVMTLKVDGDVLRGHAKSHWDFPRKIQTADVVASKIQCRKQ